jgi:hypothetical protein
MHVLLRLHTEIPLPSLPASTLSWCSCDCCRDCDSVKQSQFLLFWQKTFILHIKIYHDGCLSTRPNISNDIPWVDGKKIQIWIRPFKGNSLDVISLCIFQNILCIYISGLHLVNFHPKKLRTFWDCYFTYLNGVLGWEKGFSINSEKRLRLL